MKSVFLSGGFFSLVLLGLFPDGWTEAVTVIRFKIFSEMNSGPAERIS